MSEDLPKDSQQLYRPNVEVLRLLQRQEISNVFPSLAEIYESLFRTANDRQNKDRFSQTAHSIRELMNLAVRKGKSPSFREKVQALFDRMGWTEENLGALTAKELLNNLYQEFDGRDNEGRVRAVLKCGKSFAAAWNETLSLTLRFAHHGDGVFPTEKEMRDLLGRADFILLRTYGSISDHTRAIDLLIELGPPEKFQKVKAQLNDILSSPVLCGYFLGKLQDAAWIPMLHRAGFFKSIAEPIPSNKAEKAPSEVWPAWRYLAKVAETADAQHLMKIVNESKHLENPAVVSEALEAIVKIPADQSAFCADTVASWITQHCQIDWLGKAVGDLLKKWIERKQNVACFIVLSTLLKPRLVRQTSYSGLPKIEIVFSEHWLWRLLAGVLPGLQAEWLEELIDLLEKQLTEVSALLGKKDKSTDSPFISYWRNAIEASDQDQGRDELQDVLVPALRNALENLLSSNPQAALGRCEKYIWGTLASHAIFVRMGLHIASLAVGKTWESFHLRILKEPKFVVDDFWYNEVHHERHRFLERIFPVLTLEDRKTALTQFDSFLKEIDDAEKRTWPEQRWLHAAEKGLEDFPKWKARLAELNQERSLGDHPEFKHYMGEVQEISLESQIKAGDLRSMDLNAILGLIQNPPSIQDDFFNDIDHRKRALGRDIQEAVKADPVHFIGLGEALLRLDESWPTLYWVQGFIEAFNGLDWTIIDQLVRWGHELAKKQEPVPLDTGGDRDLDVFYWAGAYCTFFRFLDHVVKSKRDDLTEERLQQIRDVVIAVITSGTPSRDPDWAKAPDRRVLLDYDPMHDAINTAAGVGVEVLMNYVIVRVSKKYPGHKSPYPIDAIEPEVLAALEVILDDPRPYMRCMVGSNFRNLCVLKHEWMRERISRIFPKENQELWLGGMAGFLMRGQPIGGCIEELKPHYAKAVDLLPSLKEGKERLHGDPFTGLARHLMISYLWGCLGLEPGGIIQKFFQTAPLEYREEAISFLGGVLRGQGDLVKKNADWWPRMKILWAERLAHAKEKKNGSSELRAFARWLEGLPEPIEAIFTLLKDSAPSFDNWNMKELFEYLKPRVKSSGQLCLTVIKSLALGNAEFPIAGVFWYGPDLFSLMEKFAAEDSLKSSADFREIIDEIVRIKSKASDAAGAAQYRQLLEGGSISPNSVN